MDDLTVGHLMAINDKKCFRLNASPFMIGRNRGADIVCRNLTVSRLHCVLRYEPNKGWLLTNHSLAGTLVDNKAITVQSSIMLIDGNNICIGDGNDKEMWVFSSICSCTQAEASFEASMDSLSLQLDLDSLSRSISCNEPEFQKLSRRVDEFVDQLTSALEVRAKEVAHVEQSLKVRNEEIEKLKEEKKSAYICLTNLAQEKSEAEKRLNEIPTIDNLEQILKSELQCSVCSELLVSAVTLNCAHTFCKLCLIQWKRKICPICRSNIVSKNRSLVLDNYIQRMAENLSDELKNHRAQVVEERRRVEEQMAAPVVIRRRNSQRGRGRRGPRHRRSLTSRDFRDAELFIEYMYSI